MLYDLEREYLQGNRDKQMLLHGLAPELSIELGKLMKTMQEDEYSKLRYAVDAQNEQERKTYYNYGFSDGIKYVFELVTK